MERAVRVAGKAKSLSLVDFLGVCNNNFSHVGCEVVEKSEIEFMDEISFVEITKKGNKDTKMLLKIKMNSV